MARGSPGRKKLPRTIEEPRPRDFLRQTFVKPKGESPPCSPLLFHLEKDKMHKLMCQHRAQVPRRRPSEPTPQDSDSGNRPLGKGDRKFAKPRTNGCRQVLLLSKNPQVDSSPELFSQFALHKNQGGLRLPPQGDTLPLPQEARLHLDPVRGKRRPLAAPEGNPKRSQKKQENGREANQKGAVSEKKRKNEAVHTIGTALDRLGKRIGQASPQKNLWRSQ